MKLLSLILLALSFSCSANAQFGMPSYREVARAFFSSYVHTDKESYITFYRTKSGWYICKKRYENPDSIFAQDIFWSASTRTFIPINFTPTKPTPTQIEKRTKEYLDLHYNEFDDYPFQRNMYFGYTGWEWDIIRDAKSFENKNDTILESYARAFSEYAMGYIHQFDKTPFLNNDADRKNLAPTERLGKSRKEKFIHYLKRGIDAYTTLARQNPYYETRIVNINVKLANEYMLLYSELLMDKDPDRGLPFARKAVYPDSLLRQCKSFLDAVPAGSILITGHDNDTYPVWYLQDVEKYRQDVLVANYNMLYEKRYLLHLKGLSPLPLFSTPYNRLLDPAFLAFYYSNSGDQNREIRLEDFLKNLADKNNPYEEADFNTRHADGYTYYSQKVYFQKDNRSAKIYFPFSTIAFLNDYILLDILLTNQNRPIYSTTLLPIIANALDKTESGIYRVVF